MLTSEQIKQLKEQLLGQLANFPEDKRESMKEQILMMNDSQFEEFLIKNGLISGSGSEDEIEEEQEGKKNIPQKGNSCIFCSILAGNIPSYKIDENKESVAILEINPLSKGHFLVIPKNHIKTEKIPSSAFALAKKIAGKINTKFNPKEIKISSQNMFGHALVEVIPIYGNEKEKRKASEKELFELQKFLIVKTGKLKENKLAKPIHKEEKRESSLPKLKPRIP